ncbi:hypothetical protein ACEPPN_016716 [Leptodophora sp. 'Broadleaf-Isolate-01']
MDSRIPSMSLPGPQSAPDGRKVRRYLHQKSAEVIDKATASFKTWKSQWDKKRYNKKHGITGGKNQGVETSTSGLSRNRVNRRRDRPQPIPGPSNSGREVSLDRSGVLPGSSHSTTSSPGGRTSDLSTASDSIDPPPTPPKHLFWSNSLDRIKRSHPKPPKRVIFGGGPVLMRTESEKERINQKRQSIMFVKESGGSAKMEPSMGDQRPLTDEDRAREIRVARMAARRVISDPKVKTPRDEARRFGEGRHHYSRPPLSGGSKTRRSIKHRRTRSAALPRSKLNTVHENESWPEPETHAPDLENGQSQHHAEAGSGVNFHGYGSNPRATADDNFGSKKTGEVDDGASSSFTAELAKEDVAGTGGYLASGQSQLSQKARYVPPEQREVPGPAFGSYPSVFPQRTSSLQPDNSLRRQPPIISLRADVMLEGHSAVALPSTSSRLRDLHLLNLQREFEPNSANSKQAAVFSANPTQSMKLGSSNPAIYMEEPTDRPIVSCFPSSDYFPVKPSEVKKDTTVQRRKPLPANPPSVVTPDSNSSSNLRPEQILRRKPGRDNLRSSQVNDE